MFVDQKEAEAGGFEVVLELTVDNAVQIRHTALEAARQVSNSTIREAAGDMGYALRVHKYPHNILRENKQATGAGADRVCLLYTSPSPRDLSTSRMPSSA